MEKRCICEPWRETRNAIVVNSACEIHGNPGKGNALTTLEKLNEVVEEVEAIEPARDCEAYVKRELLARLDRAHEMLASLMHDASKDGKPAA